MRRTPESRLPHDGSLRTARTDLGERGLDPFDGSPVGALEAPAGGAFDVSAGRGASEGGGHHGLGIRLAFEEGDLGEEEPGFETSQGDALGQDLVGAGPGRFDVTSSQEEGGQAAQRHASVNRHGRRNFHGLGLKMSEQTDRDKEIVRRYQEAYNSGNLDVLDELLAPDWVSNSFPTSVLEQTVENAKALQRMGVEAFPDLHYTTEALIAEGDMVAQVWTARGTHKGEFVGLPATGDRFELGGISVFTIVDGRITRHHAFNDVIDLVQQCGADVPPEWMAFVHRPA